MPNWEYKTEHVSDTGYVSRDIDRKCEDMQKQGYELVAMSAEPGLAGCCYYLVFRRPRTKTKMEIAAEQ